MVSDASQDIGKPGLRVDIVEPRSLDEGVQNSGTLTTTVGSAKQPGLPTEWDTAQRPFGSVVREADPAIVEEACERIPAAEHVVDGPGEVMVAGQLAEL